MLTFCRFCLAHCGLRVTIEERVVTEVHGDKDHPVSEGYTCPKGRALAEFHHDPRRLDTPSLGRLARRPVDWNTLLDDLASRLQKILSESGPDAVAIFTGSGGGLDSAGAMMSKRFVSALGSQSIYTPLTIDGPSKPLVGALMAGQPGLFAAAIDYDHTTFTLLVGTNPVVSHGHSSSAPSPRTRLKRLLARGEVWVVDPRRTETAKMATRHLAPRPGTDHVWLAAVVRELLATSDCEEIARTTVGLDALKESVADFTLEEASRRTGLEFADLRDLVEAIRRHGRFSGLTGTGVTMSAGANLSQWLMLVLLIITDSADTPGGTWFNPGFIRAMDAVGDPSWGFRPARSGPPSRPELPRQFGQMATVALLDEIEAGRVRALLVLGGNLITCLPDADRAARALSALGVVFVADVVENETVALATHVAPCAGQLERADITLAGDQYQSVVAAQYTPALVPPQENRRELWWVLSELANRLGLSQAVQKGLGPITEDGLFAEALRAARANLETLERERVIVAEPAAHGWVRKGVASLGGWRLAPPSLIAMLHDLPDPPTMTLIPRRQLRHMNSQLTPLAGAQGPDRPRIFINPADAADAGIGDGQEMRVDSQFGKLIGLAHLDPDLRRGSVSIPHGYEELKVNSLTSGSSDVDPLTGMPLFSGLPVTISRVPDEPGGRP